MDVNHGVLKRVSDRFPGTGVTDDREDITCVLGAKPWSSGKSPNALHH